MTKASQLHVDDELSSVLRQLSPDETKRLTEALVAAGGAHDPITVWGDVIVDGYNRYRICTKLGLGFTIRRMTFPNNDAAKQWIIEHQLARRNADEPYRDRLIAETVRLKKAAFAEELANSPHRVVNSPIVGNDPCAPPEKTGPYYGGDKKGPSKNASPGTKPGPKSDGAVEATAEQFGVSRDTVERAIKADAAVKKLCKSVQNAVLSGRVTISREDIEALATLPAAKQKAAVEAVLKDKSKTVGAVLIERFTETGKQATQREYEENWLKDIQAPYNAAIKAIQEHRRVMSKLSATPHEGGWLAEGAYNRLRHDLSAAEDTLKANMPGAGCPKCSTLEKRGKGCRSCRQTGFITAAAARSLPRSATTK